MGQKYLILSPEYPESPVTLEMCDANEGENEMIIDHPYIQSAKIVTGYDNQENRVMNTLVVETTVEISRTTPDGDNHQSNELIELLTQLKSFADNDFGDFQAVEIYSPTSHYFARNLGNTGHVGIC